MVGVTRRVNRIKSRAPKSGLYWCWKCDRGIVGEGGRCKTCKAKCPSKKSKGPYPVE